MSERMSLLEFLKERSGIRLSKLEAYLDLVDKASVQYIPKDLCKQEFSLSNGQFVITITELAGCWHWHRATVRTFIEAAKAISELALDGSSPALHQESAAIKSQFQSLCRPFLAIVANQEGSCPSKGCINL